MKCIHDEMVGIFVLGHGGDDLLQVAANEKATRLKIPPKYVSRFS